MVKFILRVNQDLIKGKAVGTLFQPGSNVVNDFVLFCRRYNGQNFLEYFDYIP